MGDEPFAPEPGEKVLLEAPFDVDHPIFKVARFLAWLRLLKPLGDGVVVTDRRVVKRFPAGRVAPLPLDRVERVYWNTTSDSFAVVARPDRSIFLWRLFGRGRRGSLQLPVVKGAKDLAAALEKAGLPVEQERMSPRRRYLT